MDSSLYTMSHVIDAARKQAGLDEGAVSPLRDFSPKHIAETIIYLENIAFGSQKPFPEHRRTIEREPAGDGPLNSVPDPQHDLRVVANLPTEEVILRCLTDWELAEEIPTNALVQAVRSLALQAGAAEKKPSDNLHVTQAQRVAIIREARHMLARGATTFAGFRPVEIAGALVDVVDVLVATKEELVGLQPRTLELLASAMRKLWPDLADEVVKRWMQYKAADTQLLNELLERLRK